MKLHQHPSFLRRYHWLPHRLLNQVCAKLMTARRPAFAVQAAIRFWIRSAHIDMSDFAQVPYQTVEDFFLRELKTPSRPLGPGVVSPVDGEVFACGRISLTESLRVKGQALSFHRLVNGSQHHTPLVDYEDGLYVAIFLSPRGYHYIHVPLDSQLVRCQWIPGRFFPQNAVALQHIPGVYERNERATLLLHTQTADGVLPYLMVLVGASMVGGIHLEGEQKSRWQTPEATELSRRYNKGQRLGHFSFGSTVVLLFPKRLAQQLQVAVGEEVQQGQPIATLSAP
jgi:phosphatidylserine decarboxylase